MKIYLVGGAVRDQLMGKKPHDFDYSVVLEDEDLRNAPSILSPFQIMISKLTVQGFTIFRDKENKPIGHEHFTARALFPKSHKNAGTGADFVLARKESGYTDGRRPDSVEVGTLYDDLARRDLTINAIAQDEDGSLIDPFNGQQDIKDGIIRAVGDPMERLTEDALRALRAVRFSVTLGFDVEPSLRMALHHRKIHEALKSISNDRKMDELNKMFHHDAIASLNALQDFRGIRDVVFADVNLLATLKQKGFK